MTAAAPIALSPLARIRAILGGAATDAPSEAFHLAPHVVAAHCAGLLSSIGSPSDTYRSRVMP